MRYIDGFEILLLDMGNTFMFEVDRFGSGQDYYDAYLEAGGRGLDRSRVNRAIDEVFEKLVRDYRDPASAEHFRPVRSYLSDHPLCRDLAESELDFLAGAIAFHERGVIPESHAAAVRELSLSHRLGLVSNVWSGPEYFVERLVEAGLDDCFDFLAFSSSVFAHKPSSLIFQAALDGLMAEASDCLMVGDSQSRDVEGAWRMGMASVLIEGNGKTHETVEGVNLRPPDRRIESLLELARLED